MIQLRGEKNFLDEVISNKLCNYKREAYHH